MQVPALIRKHQQSPRIVILGAVRWFVVLPLSTFSDFFILLQVFRLPLATLPIIVEFFLTAPLSDRDKKRVCHGLLLPRSHNPSSLTTGGPVFLLVCGFRRRDSILACSELFTNLSKLKCCIWFWEEYIHFERSYRVFRSTDSRQISPKHSWNNKKRNCVGKFWYLKYFSRGVYLRNTSRIFLATCLNNQSEYRKKLNTILLVDALWMRRCSHFACAAASDIRYIQ